MVPGAGQWHSVHVEMSESIPMKKKYTEISKCKEIRLTAFSKLFFGGKMVVTSVMKRGRTREGFIFPSARSLLGARLHSQSTFGILIASTSLFRIVSLIWGFIQVLYFFPSVTCLFLGVEHFAPC